jgi:alcohol dehydrogenase class IV
VDSAVEQAVRRWGAASIGSAAVVAVGGGSALDAGKAIAAMLGMAAGSAETSAAGASAGSAAGPAADSSVGMFARSEAGIKALPRVEEYLEGVGSKAPDGRRIPFIACPTTAGTGSEATKNAVISRIGAGGFKKSLRHEGYIPDTAIVDPELAIPCPPSVSAAGGLDALTQLVEAWTSPQANPFIDSLCASGVSSIARSFPRVLADGADLEARSGMAYAAYLSGIALANAGLGSVHALASAVGSRFPIPHGVVCGTLLAKAAELNIQRLKDEWVAGGRQRPNPSLIAYSQAGYALSSADRAAADRAPADWNAAVVLPGMDYPMNQRDLEAGLDRFVESAAAMVEDARLAPLSFYGCGFEDLGELASCASAKTNPVPLTEADYLQLLASCFR